MQTIIELIKENLGLFNEIRSEEVYIVRVGKRNDDEVYQNLE